MTFWTDPRLDILKAGLADGKSFAEIAAEIGAGCTRNAAIGKAQRIGIAPGRKAPPKWDREPAAERLAAAGDVVLRPSTRGGPKAAIARRAWFGDPSIPRLSLEHDRTLQRRPDDPRTARRDVPVAVRRSARP